MLIICLLDSIICLLDLYLCLLDFWLCLLDLLFKYTLDFLIYFYACNFKRIYAFELHIFLLQKLHGWKEIEIIYIKI